MKHKRPRKARERPNMQTSEKLFILGEDAKHCLADSTS
jgi:hypothetical protein